MVTANGCVVDVHPTETVASVRLGGVMMGHVDGGDAPVRHAAAGAALRTAIDEGLFDGTATVDFDFYTYGDTMEELRDYIVETWRNARIDEETVRRTRAALGAGPAGLRPCVLERVRLTTLRPLGAAVNRHP